MTLALRTQQVIAHETGVTAQPDPLGGSYFVERLTLDMEAAAHRYIQTIDEMGGMIPAIERGYPQSEIAQASYEYQKEIERGEQVIVGVNKFTEESEAPIDVLQIDASSEGKQIQRLEVLKRTRSAVAVANALDDLRHGAEGRENTIPLILGAVRAYATVGEICGALKEVFGSYTETSVL